MNKTKEYKSTTSVRGYEIGLKNNFEYIGIPDWKRKKANVLLIYKGQKMTVRHSAEPETKTGPFMDKYNMNHGKAYFLEYFRWQPVEEPMQISHLSVLKEIPEKHLENMRKVLKIKPKHNYGTSTT